MATGTGDDQIDVEIHRPRQQPVGYGGVGLQFLVDVRGNTVARQMSDDALGCTTITLDILVPRVYGHHYHLFRGGNNR